MASEIKAGDMVRFSATLSNGSTAKWAAVVVRVENGIASVRHPRRAARLPFSPVPKVGVLYRYRVEALTPHVVTEVGGPTA